MVNIQFIAPEFQTNGQFRNTKYQFIGDQQQGWEIQRAGKPYLSLGPGYQLLSTRYCGICATDIQRCSLPFPLPQITGHEITAFQDDHHVVIEINASHTARHHGIENCTYCQHGMERHCPDRLTIGINRLPGGFAPYVLAPIGSILQVPNQLSALVASFTEPFAAAQRALEITTPDKMKTVAVLGPRRLGMLILAALAAHRHKHGYQYQIFALVRNPRLQHACMLLGADQVIVLQQTDLHKIKQKFDIVYETTGTPQGLQTALDLSHNRVHLKSTHGQSALGISQISTMVVDELSLAPWTADLDFNIKIDRQPLIYISDTISHQDQKQFKTKHSNARFVSGPMTDTMAGEIAENFGLLPGFDAALVHHPQEIDNILNYASLHQRSLLRPGGMILLKQDNTSNILSQSIIDRGIRIDSSRCGSFAKALQTLKDNPKLTSRLENHWLTVILPLNDLAGAFDLAADNQNSIKVTIDTEQN